MRFLIKMGLFGSLIALMQVTSAQSCSDNMAKSAPDSRYTLQGAEVLDKATRLIWKRCSEGQQWDAVTNACTGSADTFEWSPALMLADGQWRLPNIKELFSLVEIACFEPAINIVVFPDTPNGLFISSSSQGRYINFTDGDYGSRNPGENHVRLVRNQ